MMSFPKAFATALLLLCVAATMLPQVEAGRLFFGRSSAIAQPPRNTYHRLHDVLGIGNDPNEDIRANVILNMEGL